MKTLASNLFILVGAPLVGRGLWMIYPPACLILAGLGLIYAAWALHHLPKAS